MLHMYPMCQRGSPVPAAHILSAVAMRSLATFFLHLLALFAAQQCAFLSWGITWMYSFGLAVLITPGETRGSSLLPAAWGPAEAHPTQLLLTALDFHLLQSRAAAVLWQGFACNSFIVLIFLFLIATGIKSNALSLL